MAIFSIISCLPFSHNNFLTCSHNLPLSRIRQLLGWHYNHQKRNTPQTPRLQHNFGRYYRPPCLLILRYETLIRLKKSINKEQNSGQLPPSKKKMKFKWKLKYINCNVIGFGTSSGNLVEYIYLNLYTYINYLYTSKLLV